MATITGKVEVEHDVATGDTKVKASVPASC